MRKFIPNIITLLNLFCGCCALVFILDEQFLPAFGFIFLGGLADYSDGLVARWLGVSTEMGKELDSLADLVTFGVVPGAILYRLLIIGFGMDGEGLELLALPAFFVSVFAALRLAKFNLDTRQSEHFIGLNTPSSTMFVVGLMMIYEFDSFGLAEWVTQPILLYSAILLLCVLQVAELPMFSLKFKQLKWKDNELRFTFLLLGILIMVFLQEASFSLIIILYILFSLMGIKKLKSS